MQTMPEFFSKPLLVTVLVVPQLLSSAELEVESTLKLLMSDLTLQVKLSKDSKKMILQTQESLLITLVTMLVILQAWVLISLDL
jgi:hypothetical protein